MDRAYAPDMTSDETEQKRAARIAHRISIAALVVGIVAVALAAGVADGRLVVLGILAGVAAVVLALGGLVRGQGGDRILAGLGGAVGVVAVVVGFTAV